MQTNHLKIGIVGFGEAARAFASGWERPDGTIVSAYDVKIAIPGDAEKISAVAAEIMVDAADSSQAALAGAAVVFSLVTADRALEAARQSTASIEKNAFYFDCNSCSPATKAAAAALIEEAGGRYVDVAVMAPVHPARHLVPLLVGGPHGEDGAAMLSKLGMKPRVAGEKIGQASAIKMLRSVIIKGFEALTAEAMLAARRAGVEEAVIASLQASDPGIDWQKRSAYNLERMIVHGERRSAEMLEVAATLRELGLPDRISMATSVWQKEIADLHVEAGEATLASRADTILNAWNG